MSWTRPIACELGQAQKRIARGRSGRVVRSRSAVERPAGINPTFTDDYPETAVWTQGPIHQRKEGGKGELGEAKEVK